MNRTVFILTLLMLPAWAPGLNGEAPRIDSLENLAGRWRIDLKSMRESAASGNDKHIKPRVIPALTWLEPFLDIYILGDRIIMDNALGGGRGRRVLRVLSRDFTGDVLRLRIKGARRVSVASITALPAGRIRYLESRPGSAALILMRAKVPPIDNAVEALRGRWRVDGEILLRIHPERGRYKGNAAARRRFLRQAASTFHVFRENKFITITGPRDAAKRAELSVIYQEMNGPPPSVRLLFRKGRGLESAMVVRFKTPHRIRLYTSHARPGRGPAFVPLIRVKPTTEPGSPPTKRPTREDAANLNWDVLGNWRIDHADGSRLPMASAGRNFWRLLQAAGTRAHFRFEPRKMTISITAPIGKRDSRTFKIYRRRAGRSNLFLALAGRKGELKLLIKFPHRDRARIVINRGGLPARVLHLNRVRARGSLDARNLQLARIVRGVWRIDVPEMTRLRMRRRGSVDPRIIERFQAKLKAIEMVFRDSEFYFRVKGGKKLKPRLESIRFERVAGRHDELKITSRRDRSMLRVRFQAANRISLEIFGKRGYEAAYIPLIKARDDTHRGP